MGTDYCKLKWSSFDSFWGFGKFSLINLEENEWVSKLNFLTVAYICLLTS